MQQETQVIDRPLAGKGHSSHRARQTLLTLLLMGGCLWLGAAVASEGKDRENNVPDELRAKRFVVDDGKGNVRGEFGLTKNGGGELILWSKDSQAAFVAGMDLGDRPRVVLQNAQREAILDFGMMDDDTPVLALRQPDGTRRLAAMVTGDGKSLLWLLGPNKEPRCSLTVGPDGTPEFVLTDEKGKSGLRMTVDGDDHMKQLELWDSRGKPRIVLLLDAKDQAAIGILNSKGEMIWSAPQQ